MNWHERYLQQAGWTQDLRAYLFDKTGLAKSRRVLEVGCGTGAILSCLSTKASIHGLDISFEALEAAQLHASLTTLTNGDALSLPYLDGIFDIVYCHFLLLWVKEPVQALLEMKRVTKAGGYVLALAEPDYTVRIDQPDELVELSKLRAESLRRQGADVGIGARLADLFFRSGIRIVETGAIQGRSREAALKEREQEWAVLESDLAEISTREEIRRMKQLYLDEMSRDRYLTEVPTYFVWGQV